MLITYNKAPDDPPFPFMVGDKPLAREFNKRIKVAWLTKEEDKTPSEQITIVLLEIFADEYNKRHAPRKKRKNI